VRVEVKKKTLRVDLTRIIVELTRSTKQLATQRADSTRKVYFYSHAFVSNQQACGWIKIKTATKKTKSHARMRVKPARMRVESSSMRVKSPRSTVTMSQCVD
jgi:hypothetical protein